MYRGYIMVCSGPNCGRTSDRIAEEFEVQIKIAGLRQEIQVIRGSCMGLCSSGPNVIMFPEGRFTAMFRFRMQLALSMSTF